MLTDATGHSAATYDYSDYGETRQTSGSPALYNPFLYTGQEYDFETSLYHLRARHYSPANGRFFSRDPIGYAGGSNMYAYCGGDPINHADPTGLLTDFILRVFPALTAEGNVQIRVKVTTIVITDALKWPEANLMVSAVKFNRERTAIDKTKFLTSQSWSWKQGDFASQYLFSDAFELPVPNNPVARAKEICGWDALVFKTTGYFFNILNIRSFTAPDQFYLMLKPSSN
jgi:RHS repeat-associated protein